MHPLVRAAAARQHGVVTRRDLQRAGVGDQEMRTRVARGEWVRLRRGAYVAAEVLAAASTQRRRHVIACSAALLTLGRAGAVVGGLSAAAVWGLPVPTAPDRDVVLLDPAQSLRSTGLRVLMTPLPPGSTTTHLDLRVTTLARTVADCARFEDLEVALVLADAARWDDRLTQADLTAVVEGMRGWRGAAAARCVADLCRAGVESPLETRVRLRLLEAGVAEPELLVTIRAEGRVVEADGWWDAAAVVMECDGRVKYRDPWGGLTTEQKHWQEKRRAEVAGAAGVRFWRVADEDLRSEAAWSAALARLRAMLAHPLPGPRRFTVTRETRRTRRAA
ncbi:Transcriptional regulator, AbiEi antitoxin, Type IV TA system [Klenkia marina]|uniref:Transcriptional regulator, AbiEi antitoxin, Type IV TA system n=1 Tax=Klenkia marina TaxID=1960309 RepID=A0A1G4XWE0_9ACTN|nr:type IV toxin-antitoxin system AbiEi family antitoxin domain-containing protein [Klenkia marina]SCX45512.1 Transcriptional regulator, AbiEi antitoxin, Type IV TA system [Klenkia marina]